MYNNPKYMISNNDDEKELMPITIQFFMERNYKEKSYGYSYKPSNRTIWPSVPYKLWIDKSWNIKDINENCDILKDKGLILKDNVWIEKKEEKEEEKETKREWEVPLDNTQLQVIPKKLTYKPKPNDVIAIGVAHQFGIDGSRPRKKRKYKYKSKARYRKGRRW